MQSLDIHRPEMPDLQFALLVTALCTSTLTTLNIPPDLRTRIFDRCWVLIHDDLPPDRLEERVLDLRPWNDVTLEAMVETIRWTLSEAGVQILIWDHQPGDATLTSTREAQPSRLSGVSLDASIPDVRQLLGKIAASMATFPSALDHRAEAIVASDKDPALAAKLLEGVDVMRGITNTFLTWGRHYARLADDPENDRTQRFEP